MKKRNILIVVAGVAAVLCVGCFALAMLTDTFAPEAPVAATGMPTPTSEPPPAFTELPPTPTETVVTVTPTNTLIPTSEPSPAPISTPTPAMLTVRDIEEQRKALTDLQWESYAEEIVGEPIRFSGEVIEVYDDGRVNINEGKGLFTGCILHGVSLGVAASFDKDQFVQGVGTVRDVDTLLGLRVHVNVESLE